MVDDTDFERAQNLMIEWRQAIRCRRRHYSLSRNADRRTLSIPNDAQFMTPALVGLLCALKIIPKEFYCQDCPLHLEQ